VPANAATADADTVTAAPIMQVIMVIPVPMVVASLRL